MNNVAFIFALTIFVLPAMYLLFYALGALCDGCRTLLRRNIWYPNPGDVIEVRNDISIKESWEMTGSQPANYHSLVNPHVAFMEQGDQFLVVSSDPEPVEGRIFHKRMMGRIVLMPVGNREGLKRLFWNEDFPLCENGFQNFFRLIKVQESLKGRTEEQARRLLDEG